MVTRRGYLSSTGGFADGFTSGFGLMNQAYTDKRKLDQADEAMRYEREQDAAVMAEERRQFDARTAEEKRQFDATEKREADQFAKEFGLAQTEAEANSMLRQAQVTAAETAEKNDQAEIDARLKLEKEQDAMGAIAQLDQVIKTAQRTGTQPDLAVVNELLERTVGTKYDLTVALGKEYQNNIANLTNVLSTQLNNGAFDPTDPRVEMGADALVNAQGGDMIGKTIDESFVNAPAQLKNGKYKVVSREATNIQINEGSSDMGPPELMVSMDVLVTAKGPDGEIVQYIAPMTENRTGSSSVPVQIGATDLFDGLGGTAVLIDYLNTNMAEPIKAAKKDALGGEAAFQQAASAQAEFIISVAERNPNGRSFMSNKTNEEVASSPEDLQRIAEDRALGLGKKQGTYRDDARREIMQTKADLGPLLTDFRVADKNGDPTAMPDFSDKEILELSITLNRDGTLSKATRDLLRVMLERKGAVEIKRGAGIRLFQGLSGNLVGESSGRTKP